LQRFNDVAPDASNVRDPRLLTDPDAIIDTRPKVFDELAVNIGRRNVLNIWQPIRWNSAVALPVIGRG
jgi:hypothetical protein